MDVSTRLDRAAERHPLAFGALAVGTASGLLPTAAHALLQWALAPVPGWVFAALAPLALLGGAAWLARR